jgi:hypothetical protein
MSTTEIKEKIKTGVVFINGNVHPRWFEWRNKKMDVKKITYKWQTVKGDSVLLHFSVECSSGLYELSYNQKTMDWILEQASFD